MGNRNEVDQVVGLVAVKDLMDEIEKLMEGSNLEKLKDIAGEVYMGMSKGELVLKDVVEIGSDVSNAEYCYFWT
ncbi:hypothetical protein ACOSP7_014687 [Xanthoceras sorbifolium]